MSETKKGFFGKIADAAVEAGILVETNKSATETASEQSPATPTPLPMSQTTASPNANTALVEQIRGIALAPTNSPLINSFMRDLKKAQQIESDPSKVTKMALVFSDIPVKDLVKEIETPIAANLAAHKMNFQSEVGQKRTAIDARFAERQQILEAAIKEDQTRAEEIRQRLSANTAELSSLAAEKAGEVAKIDRTENEAIASLGVVEAEINTLLNNLKTAG